MITTNRKELTMNLIPTTANDQEFETYVANIIKVWNSASLNDQVTGRNWYHMAHELADMMTEGHIREGAGILAALSPMTSWDENVRLAKLAVETGTPSGHFGDALRKVTKIIAGTDPEEVLPMTMKTGMFFRLINDPTDPDAVVIDRHAHDIAVGQRYGSEDRGLSNARRYATLAHAYREAARRLGELPSTVQSVTWVSWRDAS
jgi:hypothetical protein